MDETCEIRDNIHAASKYNQRLGMLGTIRYMDKHIFVIMRPPFQRHLASQICCSIYELRYVINIPSQVVECVWRMPTSLHSETVSFQCGGHVTDEQRPWLELYVFSADCEVWHNDQVASTPSALQRLAREEQMHPTSTNAMAQDKGKIAGFGEIQVCVFLYHSILLK